MGAVSYAEVRAMIQTDADILLQRKTVELEPGHFWSEAVPTWRSGNVAFVSTPLYQRWPKTPPNVGDVVEYGGVRALCFCTQPEWADGFYLVRLRGLWTWFYLAKHHIKHWLRWPRWIAFRLAWAVYLMDYEPSMIPTWRCFKPYKWARRVWVDAFER